MANRIFSVLVIALTLAAPFLAYWGLSCPWNPRPPRRIERVEPVSPQWHTVPDWYVPPYWPYW